MARTLDILTKDKLRSIAKRKRRAKREKREKLREHFDEEMKQRAERIAAEAKTKKIRELLDTIRALQLIGADVTAQKATLNELFKSK